MLKGGKKTTEDSRVRGASSLALMGCAGAALHQEQHTLCHIGTHSNKFIHLGGLALPITLRGGGRECQGLH